MRRVVVLGGGGLFGRAVVGQLKALGISALVAARRAAADILVDANDPLSIRAALAARDLVIDAAGPFQMRSMALVDAAIQAGFDLIDINDDLGYAQQVLAREGSIQNAGIRVLSSASSVSAVAAAIVRRSQLPTPVRVTGFLAPASKDTAHRGSALSLLRSVGRPVRVFRAGRLETLRGWGESRRFRMPAPVGRVCGRLFENADAAYLPRIWPSLQEVAMYVDTNTPGMNGLLRIAARFAALRQLLERHVELGTWLSRRIGSAAGGLGYEIEDECGRVARFAVLSGKRSFVTAVAPAVLAAQALLEQRLAGTGLLLPDRHVQPSQLLEYLKSWGVEVVHVR